MTAADPINQLGPKYFAGRRSWRRGTRRSWSPGDGGATSSETVLEMSAPAEKVGGSHGGKRRRRSNVSTRGRAAVSRTSARRWSRAATRLGGAMGGHARRQGAHDGGGAGLRGSRACTTAAAPAFVAAGRARACKVAMACGRRWSLARMVAAMRVGWSQRIKPGAVLSHCSLLNHQKKRK
jgi:hypothetical protein